MSSKKRWEVKSWKVEELFIASILSRDFQHRWFFCRRQLTRGVRSATREERRGGQVMYRELWVLGGSSR